MHREFARCGFAARRRGGAERECRMAEAFDLEQYLSRGVEDIVRGILKASLQNPNGGAFLARYALASRRSAELRRRRSRRASTFRPF